MSGPAASVWVKNGVAVLTTASGKAFLAACPRGEPHVLFTLALPRTRTLITVLLPPHAGAYTSCRTVGITNVFQLTMHAQRIGA